VVEVDIRQTGNTVAAFSFLQPQCFDTDKWLAEVVTKVNSSPLFPATQQLRIVSAAPSGATRVVDVTNTAAHHEGAALPVVTPVHRQDFVRLVLDASKDVGADVTKPVTKACYVRDDSMALPMHVSVRSGRKDRENTEVLAGKPGPFFPEDMHMHDASAVIDTDFPSFDSTVMAARHRIVTFAHLEVHTMYKDYFESVFTCVKDAAGKAGIKGLRVDSKFDVWERWDGRKKLFYNSDVTTTLQSGADTLSESQRASLLPLLRQCVTDVVPAPRAVFKKEVFKTSMRRVGGLGRAVIVVKE
jgi:hypothetical protein